MARTLTDGGQQPVEIARAIAAWIDEANESLELAQYDFHLVPAERIRVDGMLVRPWFTPGFGEDLSHRIASTIGRAQKVRICSPVITAAPVLATLAELVSEGKRDIAGCVDAPQVGGVVGQW